MLIKKTWKISFKQLFWLNEKNLITVSCVKTVK